MYFSRPDPVVTFMQQEAFTDTKTQIPRPPPKKCHSVKEGSSWWHAEEKQANKENPDERLPLEIHSIPS